MVKWIGNNYIRWPLISLKIQHTTKANLSTLYLPTSSLLWPPPHYIENTDPLWIEKHIFNFIWRQAYCHPPPPLTTKIRKNLYLFCLSIKSESEVLFSVDLCNNSSHTTLLTYCLLITHATTGVPSDVQYKVTSGLHIHKNLYVTSVLPNNYKYGEFWWIPIL